MNLNVVKQAWWNFPSRKQIPNISLNYHKNRNMPVFVKQNWDYRNLKTTNFDDLKHPLRFSLSTKVKVSGSCWRKTTFSMNDICELSWALLFLYSLTSQCHKTYNFLLESKSPKTYPNCGTTYAIIIFRNFECSSN